MRDIHEIIKQNKLNLIEISIPVYLYQEHPNMALIHY